MKSCTASGNIFVWRLSSEIVNKVLSTTSSVTTTKLDNKEVSVCFFFFLRGDLVIVLKGATANRSTDK